MRPSPYTPGQVATVVPGREPQIEAIRERLSYVSQFQRFAGRIRVDVGPRGVGKTSLLRAMQAEANRIGFATVWVTAGDGPFPTGPSPYGAHAVTSPCPNVTETNLCITIGRGSGGNTVVLTVTNGNTGQTGTAHLIVNGTGNALATLG